MKASERWRRRKPAHRNMVLNKLRYEERLWRDCGSKFGGDEVLVANFFHDAIVILKQAAATKTSRRT